jgi:hypothetical protein
MSSCELHIISDDVDHVCLVDEADLLLISRYHWNIVNGYMKAGRTLIHRLILGITDPNQQVDHIDHNKLNNQRSNLRICTRSENQHNRVKQKSTSRFKGVTRYAGKWFAQIRHNNVYLYLGLFNSEVTAAKAYDRASRKLHKQYGLTNFNQADPEPQQLVFTFRDPITPRKAPLKLIERAVNEGWVKQLAFYLLLKRHFINGSIYSYRSRMDELADQFNVSVKTLYNYLNFLRSKNLVCDHTENLKLNSISEFRSKREKSIIQINDSYDLFDITCLLYCKLIERKARQQAFAESVRRFGRGERFDSVSGENSFLPSLSYRTIAKLLNVSEFKAFGIIQNLNRLKVIRSEKQKPQLISKNFSELNFIEDLPGYRYNIGHSLFEQYGNRIEFIQYPVYLKKVTISKYKKFINRNL